MSHEVMGLARDVFETWSDPPGLLSEWLVCSHSLTRGHCPMSLSAPCPTTMLSRKCCISRHIDTPRTRGVAAFTWRYNVSPYARDTRAYLHTRAHTHRDAHTHTHTHTQFVAPTGRRVTSLTCLPSCHPSIPVSKKLSIHLRRTKGVLLLHL